MGLGGGRRVFEWVQAVRQPWVQAVRQPCGCACLFPSSAPGTLVGFQTLPHLVGHIMVPHFVLIQVCTCCCGRASPQGGSYSRRPGRLAGLPPIPPSWPGTVSLLTCTRSPCTGCGATPWSPSLLSGGSTAKSWVGRLRVNQCTSCVQPLSPACSCSAGAVGAAAQCCLPHTRGQCETAGPQPPTDTHRHPRSLGSALHSPLPPSPPPGQAEAPQRQSEGRRGAPPQRPRRARRVVPGHGCVQPALVGWVGV